MFQRKKKNCADPTFVFYRPHLFYHFPFQIASAQLSSTTSLSLSDPLHLSPQGGIQGGLFLVRGGVSLSGLYPNGRNETLLVPSPRHSRRVGLPVFRNLGWWSAIPEPNIHTHECSMSGKKKVHSVLVNLFPAPLS
jgi:hypothetical protein